MKKLIRRCLLVSIILSLFLVIPCNIMAEDEESLLDGGAQAPVLTIIYNREDEDDNNNNIVSYKLIESAGEIEIDYPSQIPNLIVSYDNDSDTVIINVKNGTETNLKGYVDNSFKEIIFCDKNLKFIGEGTLNIEIISNPKIHDSRDGIHFSFINAKANLMIGDEVNNGPSIKLDTNFSSADENPYKFIEGLIAEKFALANSSLTAFTHSSVFYCSYVPPTMESNSAEASVIRLAIYNLKLKSELKYLNVFDSVCREHHLFKYGDSTGDLHGRVVIEKSNLDIKYNDIEHYLDIAPSIELKKEGTLAIINSTLNYYSNSGAMFAEAKSIGIKNSDIKYVQEEIPTGNSVYAFKTNRMVIEDSNVDIESASPIVSARTNISHSSRLSPGLLGVDIDKDHYISIVENSSEYSLKMYVNSEDEKPIFVGNNSINKQSNYSSFDSYIYIQIPKKGKIITSKLGGSKLEKHDIDGLSSDESLYIFKYDYDDPSFNTNYIKWNYLEIESVKEEPKHEEPKHEVLNTGIN